MNHPEVEIIKRNVLSPEKELEVLEVFARWFATQHIKKSKEASIKEFLKTKEQPEPVTVDSMINDAKSKFF